MKLEFNRISSYAGKLGYLQGGVKIVMLHSSLTDSDFIYLARILAATLDPENAWDAATIKYILAEAKRRKITVEV